MWLGRDTLQRSRGEGVGRGKRNGGRWEVILQENGEKGVGGRMEKNRGGGEHGGEQTFGHLRSSTSAAVVASLR